MSIRILLNGAAGKMGRAMAAFVLADPGFELAAAVDINNTGRDLGELASGKSCGVLIESDLERAIDAGLSLLNMATEPVSAGEVYRYLTGETFVNEITEDPVHYDMRTIHYEMLGGIQAENEKSGYLYRKDDILQRIKTFTEKEITL